MAKKLKSPIFVLLFIVLNISCHSSFSYRNDLDTYIHDLICRESNAQNIAIDIGAGEGKETIWLSQWFNHVLAVESDQEVLEQFYTNLQESGRTNISICNRPLAEKTEQAIFIRNDDGSKKLVRCNVRNEINLKTLTFKQMIHDNIYYNDKIYSDIPNTSKKIAFIQCDIEGNEENLVEDLLTFCYQNRAILHLHFYIDQWNSKKISDFSNLFKFFHIKFTNGETCKDICTYIEKNKHSSFILEPSQKEDIFPKKNMPAVIIGYNLFTYIKNMVSQLEKYTSDIIVIDNHSDFAPLIDYYEKDFPYTLLRQKENFGHTICYKEHIQKLLSDVYILTDPDLEFNPLLPNNFIQEFIEVGKYFLAHKVGFALNTTADDLRTDLYHNGKTIPEWEVGSWKNEISYPLNPSMELYNATIDTTFCVVNRCLEALPDEVRYAKHVRIAGNYTCKHLPWHKNYQDQLLAGELESYLKSNSYTNWLKDKEIISINKMNVLHKFARFDDKTDAWVINNFPWWEKETFEIFDKVKDRENIAIDLGAWFGTTCIWLAKNFHYVIAVEADKQSVRCLEKNLVASECENVVICDRPVAKESEMVWYGSKTRELNDSVSSIKSDPDRRSDYLVKIITFNQMIDEYYSSNALLTSRKIAFIKCDIEGGEEDILEEILNFSYTNKTKALVSFHLEFWKNIKIDYFESMFKIFKTDCPEENICAYLEKNPFASILFEPL